VSIVRLICECPNVLHHDPGVDALYQQQRGTGMPQIMNADHRQFSTPKNGAERSAHVPLLKTSPSADEPRRHFIKYQLSLPVSAGNYPTEPIRSSDIQLVSGRWHETSRKSAISPQRG
jgi:hypothetical protein